MSHIDAKQFAEFTATLEKATELFQGQDAVVKGLQARINELEERITNLSAPTENMVNYGFGFHDSKTAGDFVKMVKAIFVRDPSAKDLTTGIDSDGGFLVQPEYRNTLLVLLESFGLARRDCTVFPIGTNELTMPRLTGGVQVYWIGEGQTIPQTQPSFGEFTMSVKKLAALVPMTSEFLDDASIEIANLLMTLFAQAIAKEEDRVVFNGGAAPTDPFSGVLYHPNVGSKVLATGKTSFADIDADDLAAVTTANSQTLIGAAKWYMHRTIWNVIRTLKYSGTGEYIYAAPSGGAAGTIWGYPYELVETMPSINDDAVSTPFIFFGDLSHYYIADRKAMTMARSEHVGFAQDKVFLRVINREGMAYAIPESGTSIKTAAS